MGGYLNGVRRAVHPLASRDAAREEPECLAARGGEHRERAVELAERVGVRIIVCVLLVGARARGIRTGAASLAVDHEQRVTRARLREHGRGVPLGGDATGERVVALRRGDTGCERGEIEHRDGVEVGLGDVEPRAARGEGERIRCASLGDVVGRRIEEPLHHTPRAGVDNGHAIGARGCGEESGATGGERERGGMPSNTYGTLGRELPQCERVIDVNAAGTPIGYVDAAVGRGEDGVRIRSGAEHLYDAARRDIDNGDRVREILGHVEHATIAGEREAGRVARAGRRAVLRGGARAGHRDAIDERGGRGGGCRAPTIDVHAVRGAAGGVERAAVGAEREPDECAGLWQSLP